MLSVATGPALVGCASGVGPLPSDVDVDACTFRYYPPKSLSFSFEPANATIHWKPNSVEVEDSEETQILVTSIDGRWRPATTRVFTFTHLDRPDEGTEFGIDDRAAVVDDVSRTSNELVLSYHLPAGYIAGYSATSSDEACVQDAGDSEVQGQCSCDYQSPDPLAISLVVRTM